MADAVLQVEARLKDNVTKQLGTVATKAKAFGEQVRGAFGGMGKGALQVAAGFSLAQIGMKAASMAINAMRQSFDFMVESTNKFESQMSRVRAILQPTGDDFNKLGDKAKALGESTVFTANEAASAFVEMGKLGLKTNEILAASSGVLNLAAIAQTSMSEASKATIETLNQFSLSADQSNRVVDVMAKSFTSSALDMQKFTDSMSYVGPIAGSLNVSLENTAGALSILADQGIVGSMAGTGLRFTLSQLYTESSKVGRMIGVTANDTRTLGERLAAVDKLGLSAGQMMEIFGQRAGVAANVLVKHREKVDEMTESYKNATGTGNKMADDMLNNVEGRTLLLKSAQEGFAIAWGESFSDQKIKNCFLNSFVMRLITNWSSIFTEICLQSIKVKQKSSTNYFPKNTLKADLIKLSKSLFYMDKPWPMKSSNGPKAMEQTMDLIKISRLLIKTQAVTPVGCRLFRDISRLCSPIGERTDCLLPPIRILKRN
jgi:TP901 family phage tail tape measure protein